jgi:hypothetical protein
MRLSGSLGKLENAGLWKQRGIRDRWIVVQPLLAIDLQHESQYGSMHVEGARCGLGRRSRGLGTGRFLHESPPYESEYDGLPESDGAGSAK